MIQNINLTLKDNKMTNEFTECLTKITNSITRLPDKLSTTQGEKNRQEFASIFGTCILGRLEDAEYGYMALPFQASLLTDPIIFIVAGGHVILDHPVRDEQHIWIIPTHTVSLNQKVSLFENRHPRLIAIPHSHGEVQLSWMMNRLRQLEFVGPFTDDSIIRRKSNATT